MNKLLAYYQKELRFLKQHGKIFAAHFPKIARRLGIVEGETEDPHVSRLVESFALLTSRIHKRLDDDMPEVVDALLSVLAPQFLRPLPPVCIAMFSPDPLRSGLTGKNVLPPETALFTRQPSSQPVQFKTVYPVTLLPLSVCTADLDFNSDELSWQLLLCFRVWPGATLNDERIRLYLHGPNNAVSTLYTLLCSEIHHLTLHVEAQVIPLSARSLLPVGFEKNEALLTREPRIAPVHILLLDYFWFPQKFAFIDIQLPAGFSLAGNGYFELKAQFNRNALTERLEKLAPLIDEKFFRLNCTPAVNLFSQCSEPIVLNDATSEYPVVPDIRYQSQTKVWAIQQVTVQRHSENHIEHLIIQPLLGDDHSDPGSIDSGLRWQSIQREMTGPQSRAYHTMISFSQRPYYRQPEKPDIASAHLLCSNGMLAHQLQYGDPRGDFDSDATIAGLTVTALVVPTKPVDPPEKNSARWRFLSQMSLNHQLLSGEQGVQLLIESLKLYCFDENQDKKQLFALIKDLRSEPITARLVRNDPHSLARGLSLTLIFEHAARMNPEYYLLCSLLDRLLALYAPVNSFIRLTTCIEYDNETRRVWPLRAGRLSWL